MTFDEKQFADQLAVLNHQNLTLVIKRNIGLIEQARDRGVPHKEIFRLLQQSGFKGTFNTYRITLKRVRSRIGGTAISQKGEMNAHRPVEPLRPNEQLRTPNEQKTVTVSGSSEEPRKLRWDPHRKPNI